MAGIFVGRENEIELIRKALLGPLGEPCFILINGDAGVGKTTLLQELPARMGDLPAGYVMGDTIIDFDDPKYRFLDGLSVEIARQLGSGHFQPYLDIVKDRRQVERRGASPSRLARLSLDAEEMFAECLTKYALHRRVILRFDTAEKILSYFPYLSDEAASGSRHPFVRLIETALKVPNLVSVIAGRAAEALYLPLLDQVDERSVVLLSLQPLGVEDSRQVLSEAQRSRSILIDPKWEVIFHYLSGGFPIILNMAIEWVERDAAAAADWLSGHNMRSRLQKHADILDPGCLTAAAQEHFDLGWFSEHAPAVLTELQKQFRRELVVHIGRLRSLDDLLTLTLAKVNPLDVEGIAEILDTDRATAQALYDRAVGRANIKVLPDRRIRLTDAMEELVLRYVWPEVDLEGTREHRDSVRAIRYLSKRSATLLDEIRRLRDEELVILAEKDPFQLNELYNKRLVREQEFWVTRTERLERQLVVDPSRGYETFSEDFELAGQFGYLVARESLIGVIRPHLDELDPGTQLSFYWKLAQHLTVSGRYEEAIVLHERIAKSVDPLSPAMAEILIGQGHCLMRARGAPGLGPSIRRAVTKYRDAFRLITGESAASWNRDEVDRLHARVLFSLGWAHRTLGLLNDALDFYQRGYLSAIRAGLHDHKALIANGMAYIYAILRDEERAISYSTEAIDAWQELIIEKPEYSEDYRNNLAQAYNTLGEIWIELAKPARSGRFFELVIDMFAKLAVEEWLSRAYSGRGWAKWMIGKEKAQVGEQEQAKEVDWPSALQDIEQALRLATPLDTPLVLHRQAHVLWDLQLHERAVGNWLESNRLARQVGDMFTEYNSLGDLANAAATAQVVGFDHWQDFESARTEFRARNPDTNYPVLEGLFFVYLGGLALLGGSEPDAVRHYQRGLGILSRGGTYLGFNLRGQLRSIGEQILPRARPEAVRYLGREMLAFWQRPGSPEEFAAPDAIGFFLDWSKWKNERGL
jgi:tetratricopeptide (TPR) repeat protein